MIAQLRIREILSRAGKAAYKDVELGDGPNAPRGDVQASVIRVVNKGENIDCLTFVTDTMHNRAKFISNANVETAHYKDGQWVVLDESWITSMYSKAENSTISKPASQSSDEASLSGRTDGYKKFANIPKNKQLKALQDMMADAKIEPKSKFSLVNRLAKTNDPRIPSTVKEFAIELEKNMTTANTE